MEGDLYDETRTAGLRAYVGTRWVGLAVLATFALLTPADTSWTLRLLAVSVALLGLPLVVAVERVLPASDRDLVHLAIGLTQVGVMVALVDELWIVGVVTWTVFSLTLLAQRLDPLAVLVLAYGLAWIVVLALVHEVERAELTLIAAVVWMILVGFYYQQWRSSRAEIDARYSRLVSSAKLFFWEIDIETGEIVAITGDTEGALGWTRAEVVGTSYERYLVDPGVVSFDRVIAGDAVFDNVLRMWHRDGHAVPIRNHMQNLGNGRLQAAASDVSELTAAAERITYQNEHDDLTDLYNRPGLLRRLGEELEGPDRPSNLCLLAIDLVRFMDVNDAFGHARGDEVLRIIGARLEAEADSDVVARLGGNEFAMLVRCDAHERDGVPDVVARVLDAVRRPVTIGGAGIALRASVGLARATAEVTPIELVRQADVATHHAKISRLTWSQYEAAPTEPIVERLTLAAQLDEAIADGQFRLWVQPKVSLSKGTIVGVEGLARWQHPELGLLTPNRFIGLVELSDAYQRFTESMVRQALELVGEILPHWPDAEIAVNLHPQSFDDPALVCRIRSLLDEAGLEPRHLKIEITEVDSMTESSAAIDRCHELVDAGIGLSVDDFGTGHSSLSRLRLIGPTEVKLDQSFVRQIDEREHRTARSCNRRCAWPRRSA